MKLARRLFVLLVVAQSLLALHRLVPHGHNGLLPIHLPHWLQSLQKLVETDLGGDHLEYAYSRYDEDDEQKIVIISDSWGDDSHAQPLSLMACDFTQTSFYFYQHAYISIATAQFAHRPAASTPVRPVAALLVASCGLRAPPVVVA